MADDFDDFLASSLAPAARLPDRGFVAGVQARIAVEQQLAAERRGLVADLGKQFAGLLAVAAAVWVLGSAEPVADRFAASPAVALAVLLSAFGLLVALFCSRTARSEAVSLD